MMREIHYTISPFYYGILGSVVSLICIFHQEIVVNYNKVESRLGWLDYSIFVAIGLTSALGAMTKSLAF